MSTALRNGALVIAMVAVLLAAQLGASIGAPARQAAAAEAIGHAGFAYLGGLRTFAAAVLWNRLEPVFHSYYSGTPIKDQVFALPSIYLVEALDPQFEQGYYLASFALASRGDFDRALELAERGVDNNPSSGLLRANYVQILSMQDAERNRSLIEQQAALGLSQDMRWSTPEDLFEGLAIFRSVYLRKGDQATVDRIQAAMDKISSEVDVGDHDHDGDGTQDH